MIKTNYINKTTESLDSQLGNFNATTKFISWNGYIYKGGIAGFDVDSSEMVARMPRFNAETGKQVDEGEFYSAGLLSEARRFQAGGITDSNSVSDIKSIVVLNEVLSKGWRQYNMEKTVRKVPMPDLTGKVDYISSKLAAQQKVGELVSADIDGSAYTRVAFDLWKNVVHIAKSFEAQKKSFHNIMSIDIEQASRGLASARNEQIVTVIEAADAGASGGDWGAASTTGQSDIDPMVNIQIANDVINTGGFVPNIIAMGPLAWQEYQSNSFTQETAQRWNQKAGTTEVALPGFPTLQVIIDTGMTATIALIADTQEWGILGEGPTEIAKYRNEAAGYDAWIIRDYLEILEINDVAIEKLTGVTA